jgi:hypothetical protein
MNIPKLLANLMAVIQLLLPFGSVVAQPLDSSEINTIEFADYSGWRIVFRVDGSAKISLGPSPRLWQTAPDLFDLESMESDVRPLIEQDTGNGSIESRVSIRISRKRNDAGGGVSVENCELIQNLFREVLPHVRGIEDGEYFRKILRDIPPFGISGLDIEDDQIGSMPPFSVTLYRESIYPREMTGKEDLSHYVVDRRSREYLESLRKRPAKRSLEAWTGEKEMKSKSSSRGQENDEFILTERLWPLAGILTVVIACLTWLILRKYRTAA